MKRQLAFFLLLALFILPLNTFAQMSSPQNAKIGFVIHGGASAMLRLSARELSPTTITCAVSATGWGEYFIRLGVARDISALMEYKGMTVQNAADLVIHTKLQNAGGDGGIIAIDKNGNIAVSFNSEGMYRAYIDANGKPVVEIYKK